MTIRERLINAYVVLVLAKKKEIREVPEHLMADVEIKVAEKEVEVLSVTE